MPVRGIFSLKSGSGIQEYFAIDVMTTSVTTSLTTILNNIDILLIGSEPGETRKNLN